MKIEDEHKEIENIEKEISLIQEQRLAVQNVTRMKMERLQNAITAMHQRINEKIEPAYIPA